MKILASMVLMGMSLQIGVPTGLAIGGTDLTRSRTFRQATPCEPHWVPTFGAPGLDGQVFSQLVFDDGSGPALYAGGDFTSAGASAGERGSRSGTARAGPRSERRETAVVSARSSPGGVRRRQRTGALRRRRLHERGRRRREPHREVGRRELVGRSGSGLNASVRALAVFDDGSGPALYAGGDFTIAGGVAGEPHREVGRRELVGARQRHGSASVRALTVFDDGSGPALYAGGAFTTAGGDRRRTASRSGTARAGRALGSGMNGGVIALTRVRRRRRAGALRGRRLHDRRRRAPRATSRSGTARAGRRSAAG